MRDLIFTNANGQSVEISGDRPYLIQSFEGGDGVKNNIYTVKSPSQDGQTETGKNLDTREITISGLIVAPQANVLESYRRELLTVFNPKLTGTLQYTCEGVQKVISCEVETPPAFGDPSMRWQTFSITLLCPNPFWQDITESVNEIALWLPEFEFVDPDGFEIPPGGMEFGERAPSLIVDVENPGDVPCGMRILFTALATIANPSIMNVNTREQFRIVKTMAAGEVIEVNTNWGSKGVTGTLNGQTLNYFNYADLLSSTFMQLQPGSNPLRYDSDSGLDSLDVTIRFTPQYLGV